MTNFHLGPLFRYIPAEPSGPTYLFSWPKFWLPLGTEEYWGTPVVSDVLEEIYFAEAGDTYVPPTYDLVAESPGGDKSFNKFVPANVTVYPKKSIIVRAADYPTTPDLPGTGVRNYTSGNFSASVPRRILTANLPTPAWYRVAPNMLDVNNFSSEVWLRNPTLKNIAIASVDTATDIITLASSHGWAAGTLVQSNSNLGGLHDYIQYWVGNPSGATLTLHESKAAALAGTPKVNITGSPGGGIYETGPEASRNIKKGYEHRRTGDVVSTVSSLFPGWTITGVGTYAIPGSASLPGSLIETLYAEDAGTFTASMTVAGHGTFTREYSVYDITGTQGPGGTVYFWCTGDPDVYV